MAVVPYNLTELLKEGLIMGLVGHKFAEALDANFAAITGGGGGVLPIVNGGTGATSASAARANLGLGSLAVLSTINNTLWSGAPLTVANLDTTGLGTALGLGALAYLNTVNNAQWSGTALSLTNGGTGATTAAAARTALGLATVAATGAYADLSGLPTLGSLAALSSINNSNWSGTVLSVANGGTGAGTFTNHGVLVGTGTSAITATATGSAGQVLTSNGASADPTWQPQASAGGTVPTGGTGLSSVAAHGMLVGNGTSALTVVGPGTTAYVWTSNGASADPSWQAASGGGTVPTGGTGLTTVAAHALLIGNGASALTVLTAGTTDFVLTSNGGSADPSWKAVPGGGTVPTGGTGLATVTKGALLIGNTTSALTVLAPGTTGLFLKSNGAGADPSWASGSRPPAVYISDYVVGNNVTDDHVALGTAITAWKAAAVTSNGITYLGDLIFDKSIYIGSSVVDVIGPDVGFINGGRFVFINGSFIRGSAAQYGLHFREFSNTDTWYGLEVIDAYMLNCGLRFENLDDGFPLAQVNIIRARIIDVLGTTTNNHAISLEGVYESTVQDCDIIWAIATAGSQGSCISFTNTGTATNSSNVVRNCITRNGVHGLSSTGFAGSPWLFGGTFLEAYQEGIYIEGFGFKAFAPHVENCCTGGAGAVSPAGLALLGSGEIVGLEYASVSASPSSQKYGAYLNGIIEITGAYGFSDVSGWKALYIDGDVNSTVTLVGDVFVAGTMNFDIVANYQGKLAMSQQRINAMGTTANATVSIPAGYAITGVTINNTVANAVTGGLRIGTTSGAQDVMAVLAFAANQLTKLTDAQILKRIFSKSTSQTLFIQAVTAWNSTSVNFVFDIEYVLA